MLATIKSALEVFTGSTIKHILYNYSQSEVGIRHPDGPVGMMVRDQGQADIYAGRSRSIWSINGFLLNLAKVWTLIADNANIKLSHPSSLVINNLRLTSSVYNEQKFIAVAKELPKNAGLVTSDLQINTETGRIVSGFLPAAAHLEYKQILEQAEYSAYPCKEYRKFALWTRELK